MNKEVISYIGAIGVIMKDFNNMGDDIKFDAKKMSISYDSEAKGWIEFHYVFIYKDLKYTPSVYLEKATPEEMVKENEKVFNKALQLFSSV